MFKRKLKISHKKANPGATIINKNNTSTLFNNRNPLIDQPDSWFATSTRLGQIFIGQYMQDSTDGDTPRPAGLVKTIMSLQNKEAAIQLIENWLSVPLAFMPTSTAPDGQFFQIKITTKINTPTKFILALPINAMTVLSQPDETLMAACHMQWRPLPLRLRLSCIEVSKPKLGKMESGALYLLTESFQPDWFCDVYVLDKKDLNYRVKINKGCELNILYNSLENKLAPSHSRQPLQHSNEVMVYLQAPVSVPANYLMSWSGQPRLNLENILLSSPVFLVYGKKKIATGKVIAVSQGYAVLIDRTF